MTPPKIWRSAAGKWWSGSGSESLYLNGMRKLRIPNVDEVAESAKIPWGAFNLHASFLVLISVVRPGQRRQVTIPKGPGTRIASTDRFLYAREKSSETTAADEWGHGDIEEMDARRSQGHEFTGGAKLKLVFLIRGGLLTFTLSKGRTRGSLRIPLQKLCFAQWPEGTGSR